MNFCIGFIWEKRLNVFILFSTPSRNNVLFHGLKIKRNYWFLLFVFTRYVLYTKTQLFGKFKLNAVSIAHVKDLRHSSIFLPPISLQKACSLCNLLCRIFDYILRRECIFYLIWNFSVLAMRAVFKGTYTSIS